MCDELRGAPDSAAVLAELERQQFFTTQQRRRRHLSLSPGPADPPRGAAGRRVRAGTQSAAVLPERPTPGARRTDRRSPAGPRPGRGLGRGRPAAAADLVGAAHRRAGLADRRAWLASRRPRPGRGERPPDAALGPDRRRRRRLPDGRIPARRSRFPRPLRLGARRRQRSGWPPRPRRIRTRPRRRIATSGSPGSCGRQPALWTSRAEPPPPWRAASVCSSVAIATPPWRSSVRPASSRRRLGRLLALRLAALLADFDGPAESAATQLEQIVLAADVEGLPWLSRVARGLQAALALGRSARAHRPGHRLWSPNATVRATVGGPACWRWRWARDVGWRTSPSRPNDCSCWRRLGPMNWPLRSSAVGLGSCARARSVHR